MNRDADMPAGKVENEKPRVRIPRMYHGYSRDLGNNGVAHKPFVNLGVIGDFSGQTKHGSETGFITIDKDNFATFMASLNASLHITVPNRINLRNDCLQCQFRFCDLDDFAPNAVINQVPSLQRLMGLRKELTDLLPQLCAESSDSTAVNETLIRVLQGLNEEGFSPREIVDKSSARVATDAIQKLDQLLKVQLAEVIHHPDFLQLEGSWRGLRYLVFNSDTCKYFRIRVLNRKKIDLFNHSSPYGETFRGVPFDQIFDAEACTAKGERYAAVIGDFQFTHHPHDMHLLMKIAKACEAALCPFITSPDPAFLDLTNWSELEDLGDLSKLFVSPDYEAWNSFRDTELSRYVTLVLPRLLARTPYISNTNAIGVFSFEEFGVDDTGQPNPACPQKLCWMNAAYAMGANIIRAIVQHPLGLCRTIQGSEFGAVHNVPACVTQVGHETRRRKIATEGCIQPEKESYLNRQGFLPLITSCDSVPTFYGGETCRRVKTCESPAASSDACIAARLPCMMMISGISQIVRDLVHAKAGTFRNCEELEAWLNQWVQNLTCSQTRPDAQTVASFPLAESRIEVQKSPGQEGKYVIQAYLRPFLALESLTSPVNFEVIRISSDYFRESNFDRNLLLGFEVDPGIRTRGRDR